LPAPFSPTRPWISPARRVKSTSVSAATPPKDLEMPLSSSRGISAVTLSVTFRVGDQIRKWLSIHIMPGAFDLVTTGPSVMMFFGIMPMLSPVFSPETTAATPAKIAPP